MKPNLPCSAALWALSSGFLEAADATYTIYRKPKYNGQIVYPCVFLYFRSLELCLKSKLVSHGATEKDIMFKYGHRVKEIAIGVSEFCDLDNIGIFEEDLGLLFAYSSLYAEKWFEYSDESWDFPDVDVLKNLAHRVRDSVRTYTKTIE